MQRFLLKVRWFPHVHVLLIRLTELINSIRNSKIRDDIGRVFSILFILVTRRKTLEAYTLDKSQAIIETHFWKCQDTSVRLTFFNCFL